MTKGSERSYILKILEDIDEKQSFVNQTLEDYFYLYEFDKQQKNFISKVVYGTIEHKLYIDFCINVVSSTKVNKMKPTIRTILRMSTYQLLFMDKVPAHAAINEAVKMTQKRKFVNLKGFVNGVLRNIERQKDSFDSLLTDLPKKEYLSLKYSMNKDLVDYLLEQYPLDMLESYLVASLTEKPTCIHANALKISPKELADQLAQICDVSEGHLLEDSFYIDGHDQLNSISLFTDGYFQVQDESSSLVGYIAHPNKTSKVIDVCAAPGGKTTHLAMLMENSGKVVSCDVSEVKVGKIKDNCERLGLINVDVRIADATIHQSEFVECFDTVVADVPCSGLGVLRNKPDIKQNMTLEKIASLIDLQKSILQNVKDYVKVEGELIYSTCTINKAENYEQIQWFVNENPQFELVDLSRESYLDPAIKNLVKDGTIQLLTDSKLTDGFFIAKLKRIR